MNKLFACFVLIFALSGCGGGTPYVGLWQCANDPAASLEVKQFEDYFIITVRDEGKQFRRDAKFENDTFSVGSNKVGAPMAFELNAAEITCTKPPNFCSCEGVYKKVRSLNTIKSAPGRRKEEPTVASPISTQSPQAVEQIILDRDPLELELLNGGIVQLFDDVKNKDNEERMFDWSKLTYYYLPQLVLARLANGDVAEVRQIDDEVFIFFQLTVQNIDKYELMERIDESINTKIVPELVLPLSYDRLTVEMPQSITGPMTTPAFVPSSDFDSKTGALDISCPVLSGSKIDIAAKLKAGQEIATAINEDPSLPVVTIELIQHVATADVRQGTHERVMKQWKIVK